MINYQFPAETHFHLQIRIFSPQVVSSSRSGPDHLVNNNIVTKRPNRDYLTTFRFENMNQIK